MRRCAPTGCGVLQSASAFLTSALLRTRRAEGRPEHEASRSTSASAAAALSPAALTDYAAALQRWCKKRVGAGTCPCLNPAAVFLLGIFGEEAVLLHRCPRPSSCPRLSDWRHEYIIGDCGARTPSCPTHPPTGAWPPPPKGQMPFQTWCTTVRTSPRTRRCHPRRCPRSRRCLHCRQPCRYPHSRQHPRRRQHRRRRASSLPSMPSVCVSTRRGKRDEGGKAEGGRG